MTARIASFLAAAALVAAGSAQAAGFTLASPTIKPGSTLTAAQVFNGFSVAGCTLASMLQCEKPPNARRATPTAAPTARPAWRQ